MIRIATHAGVVSASNVMEALERIFEKWEPVFG